MDALRMFEFSDRFFDLVNQCAGVSYLRTWEWPKLLQEYKRVIRSGGIVRISEGEWTPECSSPALAICCFKHSFGQTIVLPLSATE
jgi:ubiquinone/menaquinone biosynthesis C-methylase UbiE